MLGLRSRGRIMSCLLAGVFAVAVGACSSGAKKGGGSSPKGTTDAAAGTAAQCTSLRAHVAGLYKTEPPDKNAKKQKRREAVIADNVTMVMGDCTKAPKRAAPCIKAAKSVAQLERDCLVQLDDEGRVEGDFFKRTP